MKHAKYPVSGELLVNIAERIFAPVKVGESSIIQWFPGTGTTVRIKQLLAEKKLLRHVLGPFYKRLLFIPLDVLELLNLKQSEWPQLILNILGVKTDKQHVDNRVVQKILMECVHRGIEPVFIIFTIGSLGESDVVSILRFVTVLVDTNRNRIHVLVNIENRNMYDRLLTNYLDTFATIFQNTVTLAIPTMIDARYFSRYFYDEWNIVADITNENLAEIFGGLFLLLKQAVRAVRSGSSNITDITISPEIRNRALSVWRLLSPSDQSVINKIVSKHAQAFTPDESLSLTYLLNSGFITKNGRRFDISIPYFHTNIFYHSIHTRNITMHYKNNELFTNDLDLRTIFSSGEYAVLTLFAAKKGKVCSKEEIAKAVWKEEYLDKGSDWSINKMISRLRKKLINNNLHPNTIRTFRSKGYQLLFTQHV